MNIFEKASRKGLRFDSERGSLTTEQLWDLPLAMLDRIAKSVNRSLKEVTEESFVSTVRTPEKSSHELRLDILKHVIASRLEENENAKNAAKKAETRQKILAAIEAKDDEEILKKTPEELTRMLEEL